MTPKYKIRVGGSRRDVTISAIVDTGFNGELCLPTDLAVSLGLELFSTSDVELADGSMKKELVFLGKAYFLGVHSTVLIYLTDSEDALIGTELLAGCTMTVDFDSGPVVIRRKQRKRVK